MTVDRTTLRRTIGDRLGDMIVLEATHASGAADQFRDVVRLGDRGDNAPSLVNKILYFSGGGGVTQANLGHEARVASFASSTRTLTFDPAADALPQEGDEAELWNAAPRIGSVATLHRFVNAAIRAVGREVSFETWDTAQTFRARSPHLTIPATWVEFGGATYTDRSGYYHDVPPSAITVQPGNRRAVIAGAPAHRANNRGVQLWGYARAAEMDADDDTTEVDAEWLVETVISWVKLAAVARASDIRGPSEERLGSFFAQQAALYRRNVAAPRRGMGIPLS